MTTEILERGKSGVSNLADTERGHRAREPYGSYAFAWAMTGALGALLGATTIVVLFF